MTSSTRDLFRRIDGLLLAMMKGQGRPEIEKLFQFLGGYVVEHFGAEEKLMAQHRYPAMASHKQMHADFVKKFRELKAAFDKDPAPARSRSASTASWADWLREHSIDTALGRHLKTVVGQESSLVAVSLRARSQRGPALAGKACSRATSLCAATCR